MRYILVTQCGSERWSMPPYFQLTKSKQAIYLPHFIPISTLITKYSTSLSSKIPLLSQFCQFLEYHHQIGTSFWLSHLSIANLKLLIVTWIVFAWKSWLISGILIESVQAFIIFCWVKTIDWQFGKIESSFHRMYSWCCFNNDFFSFHGRIVAMATYHHRCD